MLPVFMLPACALSPSARGQAVRLDTAAMIWSAQDGAQFPFKCWLPENGVPKAVVIGVHGLSGAVHDHEIVARALRKRGYAFYGAELRGQGNDPVKERIGDIRAAREWHRDLWDFHRLVSGKHPGLPVVWLGESLGSLIACGAVIAPPGSTKGPDAMVLASPIPAFDERVRLWHRQLVGVGALANPTRKIPLAEWAGMDPANWQMAEDSTHLEQLDKTPWAVKEFTVRFYHVVSLMVGRMMPQAKRIEQPVFIVKARQDAFASPEVVQAFADRLPDARLKFYDKSHHLLFYDCERESVAADIVAWIESMPWEKADQSRAARARPTVPGTRPGLPQ